jgi:hypothetical protein
MALDSVRMTNKVSMVAETIIKDRNMRVAKEVITNMVIEMELHQKYLKPEQQPQKIKL